MTYKDVAQQIDFLSPCKSPGHNNIFPKDSKELKEVLINPLVYFFYKSLLKAIVPEELKLSNITLIFKKKRRQAVCRQLQTD